MKKYTLTVLSLCLSNFAYSAIFFSTVGWDGYADGDLAGQHGWTASGFSGTTDVQVSNGSVTWGNNTDQTLIGLGQTLGAGESIYYAMKLTVTGDNSVHRFAGFKTTTASNAAQVGLDFLGPDDYRIGVTNATSISDSWNNPVTGQQYGQEYLVIAGYDYDTGVATLWLDPTSSSSTSISTASGVNQARTVDEFGLFSIDNTVGHSMSALAIGDSFSEVFAAVPESRHYGLILGVGLMIICSVSHKRRA